MEQEMRLGPTPDSFDAPVEEALELLHRQGRVWVVGPPGTGRSVVSKRLAQEAPAGHLVELPSFGPDAAFHLLLQAASVLPEADRNTASDDTQSPHERGLRIGRSLLQAGRTLVVRLPASWVLSTGPEDANARTDDAVAFGSRAREALVGLSESMERGLVLVTEHTYPQALLPWSGRRIRLRAASLDTEEALQAPEAWDEYAGAARALLEAARGGRTSSWLALRLAVGVCGLGEPAAAVAPLLPYASAVSRLTEVVARRLRSHRDVALAASRFAAARLPIPLDVALDVAAPPAEHRALFAHCLGYGNQTLRVAEEVRRSLLATGPTRRPGWPAASDEIEANLHLAQHHAALDGARDPSQAQDSGALHWLERVHHLGRSGPRGTLAWNEIAPRQRELVWQRARSLSRDFGLFREAASLYETCVKRDPADHYAWHYLAWNLEQADEADTGRIAGAFEKAVALQPANPWWNSRRITFLIDRSRPDDAQKAWEEALQNVDPGRSVRAERPWLAKGFYRWVAQAWLEDARPEKALQVLNELPSELVSVDETLSRLLHAVRDAAESQALGVSLYPASYPHAQRWRRPESVPSVKGEATLVSWHPARVEGAEPEWVEAVIATTEDDLASRRVLVRRVPADDWEAATGEPALDATGHYFIGAYSDQSLVIRHMYSERPGRYRELWR